MAEVSPVEGDQLRRLRLAEQARLLESVPEATAASMFDTLDESHQSALLAELSPERAGALFAAVHPDDRARLLSAGPAVDAAVLLRHLDEEDRRHTERLLRYPPESVGRMMTPHFLAVAPEDPREAILDRVRRSAQEIDTVYTLPVVADGSLIGITTLRCVVSADDGTAASELMAAPEPVLHPEQDQEEAARLLLTTELLAVPVVKPIRHPARVGHRRRRDGGPPA